MIIVLAAFQQVCNFVITKAVRLAFDFCKGDWDNVRYFCLDITLRRAPVFTLNLVFWPIQENSYLPFFAIVTLLEWSNENVLI